MAIIRTHIYHGHYTPTHITVNEQPYMKCLEHVLKINIYILLLETVTNKSILQVDTKFAYRYNISKYFINPLMRRYFDTQPP